MPPFWASSLLGCFGPQRQLDLPDGRTKTIVDDAPRMGEGFSAVSPTSPLEGQHMQDNLTEDHESASNTASDSVCVMDQLQDSFPVTPKKASYRDGASLITGRSLRSWAKLLMAARMSAPNPPALAMAPTSPPVRPSSSGRMQQGVRFQIEAEESIKTSPEKLRVFPLRPGQPRSISSTLEKLQQIRPLSLGGVSRTIDSAREAAVLNQGVLIEKLEMTTIELEARLMERVDALQRQHRSQERRRAFSLGRAGSTWLAVPVAPTSGGAKQSRSAEWRNSTEMRSRRMAHLSSLVGTATMMRQSVENVPASGSSRANLLLRSALPLPTGRPGK